MNPELDEWAADRNRARRMGLMTAATALCGIIVCGFVAVYLGSVTATGHARIPVTVGWLVLSWIPVVIFLTTINMRDQRRTEAVVAVLTQKWEQAVVAATQEIGHREAQARAQKLESRLANALDMAEGEPEVIEVIERSFGSIATGSPVELLLADNSHAHLVRMAKSPSFVSAGCGVDSPDHCPATRRAQVQRFPDSDELDACPKLRNRPDGPRSALCVPVSIMGRTVGVIHATAEQHHVFEDSTAQDIETLANWREAVSVCCG